MSELKCRYCGGNITDMGNGTGRCESCGSYVVMPKLNKKVDGELYNRADYLRRIHDYDGAISAYEHIVAANPADPEARWSLVLCKYGVEYTYDKRTDSYLPTINRMSLESILEDRDYIKALEYSEEAAREEYRRQALKLASIQDELEKIVRENENYDVFISFKATDENRKRTRDYFLAQEIYDALSASGLRVFFSPVSLRSHVGETYEPYIFAALYSSKVLVLVGTKREYLESEWVRNEWSRYLFMTRTNPEKHILPVCEGMKPEEFPAGIGKMQAVSMNVVGALELIKESVLGYTGGQEKRIYVKTATGEKMDLTNQLRRLQFAVEDGDFEEAVTWIQKLRGELGEKHPEIEYPALLVKYKAKDETELSAYTEKLEEDEDYLWLMQNGSEEQKKILTNLEEQKKLAQKRQFEKEFINRLSGLYKSGRYLEIIETVEAEQKNTSFERFAEIDDFYQRAKQQHNEESLLQRYKETVGNGKTYYMEQLREKYPEKAEQISFLRRKADEKSVLSGWDKAAGAGGIIGLLILVVWFVLKDSLTTPVLIFDIVLYVLYLVKYGKDQDKPDRDALSPHILLKSFLTLVVTLVAANFIFPGRLFGFSEFWARYFGNETATSDDGIVAYICMVSLFNLILWGFRIRRANGAEKKKAMRYAGEKKELLEFLKHFERQEELLLLDEYGSIDESERVELASLYGMIAKG